MRRYLGALLVFAVALGSAGCASTRLVGGGPYGDANMKSARKSAIRYYLAKDVLLVEAEVKQRRVTTLRAEKGGAGHFTFDVRTRVKFESSTATITPKTVADTSTFFQIDIENGDASADTVTVDVTDQGLLRSVNATSASQAGEIVKNIAQVGASVVSVAGLLADRDLTLVGQIHSLFDKDAQSLPKLKESLNALPIEVLYLLHERAGARALWAKKLRIEAILARRSDDLSAVEDSIPKATKAEAEGLKLKVNLLEASVTRARDERQAVIDLLETELEALRKDKHIATESITRKLSVAFDLEEVPGPALLEAGMDPVAVKAKLLEGNYPKMAQLFEDAGVVFTLTPPKLFADDPSAVPKPRAGGADSAVASAGRIFFRQSYPLVLRTFAKATLPAAPQLSATPAKPTPGKPPPVSVEAFDKEQIRLIEDRIVDLIPASAPQLYVSFAPRDFATMKLSLSFDEKGRLMRLERSGSSSLASSTDALAQGVVKARDEYATTMQKLVEIQDARRQLSVDQLQGKIDKLQKQRELLAARVSLEGDVATADRVLEKQRLDAELAALEARLALEAQRGPLVQGAQIDELKAKLDALATEVSEIRSKLNNQHAP